MGKLRVNLNGFELKNPIMTASGTYGYASEYNDFIDVYTQAFSATNLENLLQEL